VTIVMVPRERFGLTRESIESLYANTTAPFELVVVDGGAPAELKTQLEAEAARRGFRLVRSDYYLAPNEARNLALQQVSTPYVVFVDNDLFVAPGWLERLLECADETGAWVVGPVYCIGEPAHQVVHMAGGRAGITERNGRRELYEQHRHAGLRLGDLRLKREPCELVEFHCMLVRSEVFEKLGPLDEALLSTPEHLDLCLAVREAGGAIFLEPAAVVTYVPPPPLAWNDLPFFVLRWSESWTRASLDHFRRKWRLPADDQCLIAHHAWLGSHRLMALPGWNRVRGRFGGEVAAWIERTLISPAETAVHRRLLKTTRHTWHDVRTGRDIAKASLF
jgi:GT2 family glycosyltransferase